MNTLTQSQVSSLQFGDVVRLRVEGNRYMVDSNNGRHVELRNLSNGRTDYYPVDSVTLYN